MTDYAEVEWAVSSERVPYETAHRFMETRARAIREAGAPELIWLLEHPPLYTAGTSAKAIDLRSPERFPVFEAGRGGEYTYHGPGQRVAYVMLDVAARGRDDRDHEHLVAIESPSRLVGTFPPLVQCVCLMCPAIRLRAPALAVQKAWPTFPKTTSYLPFGPKLQHQFWRRS